jgi:SAM-dependent MidA family methyltransferase
MKRGAMLFVDYGYTRAEFYQDDRTDGTLRAFYRHRVHNDVYLWPGLQDITASVDFTALAEAGTNAGFDLAGYCSQTNFLLGNGITQLLEQAEERSDEVGRMRLRGQLKRLTLPTEMGERFQVMAFSRDVDMSMSFLLGDMTWRL